VEVRKVLSVSTVSKRATQQFHMDRFNFEKLNDAAAKEENQVKMSHVFAALENLEDDNVIINRALKSIRI
jgi:hypothetical protein